jgi:hypothetical protein
MTQPKKNFVSIRFFSLITLLVIIGYIFPVFAQTPSQPPIPPIDSTTQETPIRVTVEMKEEATSRVPFFEGFTSKPFSAMIFTINNGEVTNTMLSGGDGRFRWSPPQTLPPGNYEAAIYVIDSVDTTNRVIEKRSFQIRDFRSAESLFDVSLILENDESRSGSFFRPGENLFLQEKFINFGNDVIENTVVKGKILARIVSLEGFEVFRQEEDIALTGRLNTRERIITIPPTTKSGDYIALVDFTYDEQKEATASLNFTVMSIGPAPIGRVSTTMILFSFFLLLALFFLSWHYFLPSFSPSLDKETRALHVMRVGFLVLISIFLASTFLFDTFLFLGLQQEEAFASGNYKDVEMLLSVPPYFARTNAEKDLITELKLYNFSEGKEDVILRYDIQDINGRPMYNVSETVAVSTQASFTRYFDIPDFAPEGQYVVKVNMTDLSRKAIGTSASTFEVTKVIPNEAAGILPQFATMTLYGLIALCLLLIIDLTLYTLLSYRFSLKYGKL